MLFCGFYCDYKYDAFGQPRGEGHLWNVIKFSLDFRLMSPKVYILDEGNILSMSNGTYSLVEIQISSDFQYFKFSTKSAAI